MEAMTEFFHTCKLFIKRRRKFVEIFIYLFFLILTLLFIFYIVSTNRNAKNITRQYYDSQENYLKYSIQTINSDLQNACILANNTLYNSNVIRGVINPKSMGYADFKAIVNQFSDTVEQNRAINFISYYVSSTNTVYESNKSITTLNACKLAPAWNAYFNRDFAYRFITDSLQTDIMCYNGEIYLIQGFPRILDASTAYIMLALNTSIFTNNIPDGQFCIYERDQGLLYGDDLISSYKILADLETDSFYLLKSDFTRDIGIYYQDSTTGWIFFYVIEPPALSTLYSLGQAFLLFFLIMLILGFAVSILFAWVIYHPINELVLSAEEQSGNTFFSSNSKSEFDYLKSTYTKIVNHQKELLAFFPTIYNSIVEKLFYELIFGNQSSSVNLMEQLNVLNKSFKSLQSYATILAVPTQTAPDNLEQIIQNISRESTQFTDVSEILCVFSKDDLGIIVVLGFRTNAPDTNSKMLLTLCQNMLQIDAGKHLLDFGIGNIYPNITDIRISLGDAKTSLIFNQYAANSPTLVTDMSNLPSPEYGYLIRKIWWIYDQTETQKEAQLQKETKKVLSEIRYSIEDLEHKKILFGFFLNLIFKKYNSLNLKLEMSSEQIFPPILPITDEEELFDYTQNRLTQMLHIISQFYHAPNYKYIQSALEYISNHFTDSSLSLEKVSDYVGINSTYLSRIFKNTLNQNFLYYVNNCRINHAKKLLINSDLSIQEIGTVVGYSNMTTFFRVFNKYTDTTPKMFRQKLKHQGSS